ncbi:beta-fructosidase [Rossellomorea marisflavi]|nr:beta-fructosidase [Rossellomorea marisflavi]
MRVKNIFRWMGVILMLGSLWTLSGTSGSAAKGDDAIFGYVPLSGDWKQGKKGNVDGEARKKAPALMVSADKKGGYAEYETAITADKSASFILGADERGEGGVEIQFNVKKDSVILMSRSDGEVLKKIKHALRSKKEVSIKVRTDGTTASLWLDGDQVMQGVETGPVHGHHGFLVEKGKAHFRQTTVSEWRANLDGVKIGSKGWALTPGGLKSVKTNQQLLSDTKAEDFSFETRLYLTEPDSSASLIFGIDATGEGGWQVEVDEKRDLIRLVDLKGGKTLQSVSTGIQEDILYHVKIVAESGKVHVFWGEDPGPLLTDEEVGTTEGYLGFAAEKGAVFQDARVSGLEGNLEGWTPDRGEWLPHLQGVMGTSDGEDNAFRMATTVGNDFILEGDVTIQDDSSYGTAGLIFRSDGASGYMLQVDPNLDRIRLLDLKGDRTIGESKRELSPGQTHHVELHVVGASIKVYVDGYEEPAIDVVDSAYSEGRFGLNVYNGSAIFQHVYATPHEEYYSELYRPQYHYTQARGYASDPNGLVYYKGEYHLFHQDGGKWAHAVSTDLVHWKRLPIAIPWNEMGHAWSGSAVIDHDNSSGLFPEQGSGMIAYYTSFNPSKPNGDQKVGLAYSKDEGRSWQFHERNPIIPNIGEFYDSGGWDFRDPKVVRDEERDQWVMVISGGDHIRFFTSKNLIDWEMIDSFGYGDYVRGGVWECPDFFPLAVDGDEGNQKWVLSISMGANPKTDGSDTEYFIGSFDGKKFVSDHPAGTVLKNEYGKEMYATMSFSDIPKEDGRRISLGWMSNWDYPFAYPTSPWNGQMSIPREWELKTLADGEVRMVQRPIGELKGIRGNKTSFGVISLSPDSKNPLAGTTGIAYEIEADIELLEDDSGFEIGLRESGDQETLVGFEGAGQTMYVDRSRSGEVDFSEKFSTRHEAGMDPADRRVKLRIFVDGSSVEVFAGDGEIAFSNLIFPDGASDGMSLTSTIGNIKVHQFDVYPLDTVWKEANGERLQMDHDRLSLKKGERHTLSVRSDSSSAIHWSSSNPEAVEVRDKGTGEADITMKGSGRSIITAKTKGGKLKGETVVDSREAYTISRGVQGLALESPVENGSTVLMGDPVQRWEFSLRPGGGYSVTAIDSGKVLDSSGSMRGDALQVWDDLGYRNQQWEVTPLGDGTFAFNVLNSGRSLGAVDEAHGGGVVLHEVGMEKRRGWRIIGKE